MNWLEKIASIGFYYHGTSASKLKSIMSEGLNTHHDLAWGEDTDDRSRVSFGGIYLTKNLMTAIAAGGQANKAFKLRYGDPRAILMIQIENRTPSVLVDEDAMPSPESAINSAFHVNANEWWYKQWVHYGFENMDKAVDNYLQLLGSKWKIPNPKMIESLKQYVSDVIRAWAKREVAISYKHGGEYEMMRDSHDFPSLDPKEYTLSNKEAEWRSAMSLLMQKAHRLTSFEVDSFTENVRVLEPITFSGKNKIVFACVIQPDEEYYERVDIVYNRHPEAFPMFMNDYKQRVGGHFIVRNEQGEVIYQKKREDFQ